MNSEDFYISNLYQRFPVNIVRGYRDRVWDIDNHEYIDCMGGYGVAIVGHRNDRVINSIKEQLEKILICHMSLYNETRLAFLERLHSILPSGLDKVFFSNSGAEAIEAALKFSRKHSGKKGIISMNGGYHGKTFGALSVTYSEKYRKPFLPLLDGVKFVPYGDIIKLEKEIDDSVGSIILEPIQGETGIVLPPPSFIKDVRDICDDKGILLIFDEIQTGLGRTGKIWAGEHWNVTPDIMCIAKGIAGGIPMGLTITKPEILSSMKMGEHSSTFAGNPVACAAGIGVIDSILKDDLISNANENGNYFIEELKKLKEKYRIIREVRGRGFMIGIELRFDVKDILYDGISQGLLMLYSGKNILRLLPPILMDRNTVSETIDIIDKLIYNEEKRRNVF